MGFSGIGMTQLLIVLVIVIMVFGTKKLRNMGGDLGSAIKGFKNAMGNDDKSADKDGTADKKIDVNEGTAKDVEKQKQKESS